MKQKIENEKKKKLLENQEKVLRDNAEAWEKSALSHKVIRVEEKFEKNNKVEKIFYLNNLQASFFVKEHLHALPHFLKFVSYLLKSKYF